MKVCGIDIEDGLCIKNSAAIQLYSMIIFSLIPKTSYFIQNGS